MPFGRPKQALEEGVPLARPVPRDWPVADDPITLTLTANAGVLIDYAGTRLLLDGLHDGAQGFSAVPQAVREAVLTGQPPFEGIRWLLYTHLHSDHFSPSLTSLFLQEHPAVQVIAPEGVCGKDAGLFRQVCEDETGFFTLPIAQNISLRAFFSPHAGEEYGNVAHCCYLLCCGARHVLFVGDADYRAAFFAEKLRGIMIDAAVVNPLFISGGNGRRTLAQGIAPRRIVVNHIPFRGEDPMRFREMVVHCLQRYEKELPPAAVLWDANATVAL